VDELAEVRASLVTLLRRAGYEVLAAGGGPAALETLERRGADLVLTDLHLPEMTGWDLARLIRARGITNGSGLPVCLGLYSAVLGAFTREQLARAQVDFTLTRPRDPEAVLEAVERALAWSEVG
jgi:CheY-like chemotaxis protein